MAELGFAGYKPEGRIYPDTYHFPAGTRDVDFLRRAIEMQEQVLMEEWQQRDENLPYDSPYQALVMASIIEKETGVAEERGMIAGVFVRRLRKIMKLQTDPTVIYAMGDIYKGNIRKKDLSIDSPYNTYRYRGLPPTPIASAGRDALHAALHPEPGESLLRGKGRWFASFFQDLAGTQPCCGSLPVKQKTLGQWQKVFSSLSRVLKAWAKQPRWITSVKLSGNVDTR